MSADAGSPPAGGTAAEEPARRTERTTMKFTDGYWQTLPGVSVLQPRAVAEVVVGDADVRVYAPTAPQLRRGDSLNRPLVTVAFDSPMDDVIRVRIEHFSGGVDRGPHFAVAEGTADVKIVGPDDGFVTLQSGALSARI